MAKAFCSIPITISPGARNWAKGIGWPCSVTARPLLPSATVKITRNSSVVTAGAHTVWSCTLKKRRTSFTYRVLSPPQLTLRITGTPGWGSWGGWGSWDSPISGWPGIAARLDAARAACKLKEET